MRLPRLFNFSLVLTALLVLSGCSTPPSDQPGLPPLDWNNMPDGYSPLQVHNACFVESVHFCDFYGDRRLGGSEGWAKVIEWGERRRDMTVRDGHAVAVYELKNKLWCYDINHGFSPIATPVGRRADLAAVTPKIIGRYSELDIVGIHYVDELTQPADKPAVDYTKGATTMDLDEALHVAVELGKFRPVRVVEFIAPRDSYLRPFAATVFKYGTKLCLYSSWTGTRVIEAPDGADINDLDFVRAFVLSVFRDADHVKWFQPAKAVVIQ